MAKLFVMTVSGEQRVVEAIAGTSVMEAGRNAGVDELLALLVVKGANARLAGLANLEIPLKSLGTAIPVEEIEDC